MVKGVNRKIIEINNTGNIYFERAILFVNHNLPDHNLEMLKKKAQDYLSGSEITLPAGTPANPPQNKKRRLKKQRIRNAVIFSFALIIGFILAKTL